MAKRKPARNSKGQYIKKRRNKPNPPRKRRRKSRKKTTRKRRRTAGKGTTVVVRTNAPKRRRRRKGRRRRNPAMRMPAWGAAALAAGGVALGVQLVKMYVPVAALKTPMVSAFLGPAAALIGSAMLYRRPRTRPAAYALLGAGVYALTSYATVYAGAMWAQKKEAAPAASNPYHRGYGRRRETRGVPADQKPRLARGVTSMPLAQVSAAYEM